MSQVFQPVWCNVINVIARKLQKFMDFATLTTKKTKNSKIIRKKHSKNAINHFLSQGLLFCKKISGNLSTTIEQ